MKIGITRSVWGTKGVNCRSEAHAAAWSYIMAEQLVLGDVVRQLALLMKEKGIVLAFKNEEPWHLLFFRMKQELADGPSFLRHLRFDADNRYPRCRERSTSISLPSTHNFLVQTQPVHFRVSNAKRLFMTLCGVPTATIWPELALIDSPLLQRLRFIHTSNWLGLSRLPLRQAQ